MFKKCIALVLINSLQSCTYHVPDDSLIDSDFINIEPRKLSEYDLENETFPCRLLQSGGILTDTVFTIKSPDKELHAVCRKVLIGKKYVSRGVTLYTKVDCNTRLWDYNNSILPQYRKLFGFCVKPIK